ncbi:hypothetical protein A2U01_0046393, partial [Trifolium medium]|nr:hypothetical protein [Trifolium medium]
GGFQFAIQSASGLLPSFLNNGLEEKSNRIGLWSELYRTK